MKSLMYVVLDQGYLATDKVLEVQNSAEETTKTIKGLLRYLYRKTQKSGNKIAEQEVIYNTKNDSLGNDLLLDLPEEFIIVLKC